MPATHALSADPAAPSSPLLVPPGITVPDVEMLRATTRDFQLYTASLEDTGGVLTSGEQSSESMVLHAIGSSTVQDLQGDTMELSALQDMTKIGRGFAIMLNHSYQLPEDLAGHLIAPPSIQINGGIGDLHMDISIWGGNPRAVATYQAIHEHKTTLGISIGCMIDDAEWRGPNGEMLDQNEIDFWDVIEGRVFLHITHVTPVEFSIVSIPANRRSWVQNAAAGLFQRSLQEEKLQQARLLAPIVRADDASRYTKIVRGVSNPHVRRQLGSIAPRAGSSKDVLWSSKTKAFYLTSGSGQQEIDRDSLSALLAKHAPGSLSQASAAGPENEPDLLLDDGSDDLTAKGATGKSSWPLAERDHAWDGGEAHKRLLDWAGGQEDLNTSKFRSVHFWSPEGEDTENVSQYKLAFCDVIDGSVKAIPKGLMACWGGHGVEAADIPEADKDAIKKKLSAYAARMRQEFGDDSIMPPWDKEEEGGKAMGDDLEAQKATSESAADEAVQASAAAAATAERPENAAQAQMSAAPEAAAAAAAGDAEAEATPEEPAVPEDKTVSGTGGDLLVKADGNHDAYTGSHSHSHPAFGSQGDDATHSHEHSHDGDANHHHSHQDSLEQPEQTDSAEPEEPHGAAQATMAAQEMQEAKQELPAAGAVEQTASAAVDVVAAHKAQALALYNSIGASLGFAPVTLDGQPDAQYCGLVDNENDAQRVITLVSGLDTLTDELMQLLQIRDVDEEEEGEDEPAGASYAIPSSRIVQRAIQQALLLKAGREFSTANLATLQSIHDALNDMTDGALCKAVTSSEEEETTDDAGVSDGQDILDQAAPGSGPAKSLSLQVQMLASVEAMGRDVAALIQEMGQAVKHVGQFDSAKAAAESLQAQVTGLEAKLAGQQSDLDAMEQRLERMREVPLPRPTQMARSVRPTDPALARYDDFLQHGVTAPMTAAPLAAMLAATAGGVSSSSAEALDEATMAAEYSLALERTQIIRRDTDGLSCRFWPAGVGFLASGQSVRPALQPEQKASMGIQEWTAYESGGAALVPEPGF